MKNWCMKFGYGTESSEADEKIKQFKPIDVPDLQSFVAKIKTTPAPNDALKNLMRDE